MLMGPISSGDIFSITTNKMKDKEFSMQNNKIDGYFLNDPSLDLDSPILYFVNGIGVKGEIESDTQEITIIEYEDDPSIIENGFILKVYYYIT